MTEIEKYAVITISIVLVIDFAFYCTAFNAVQSCQEKAVCLSVKRMHALWQNGIKIRPDFYTIRKII